MTGPAGMNVTGARRGPARLAVHLVLAVVALVFLLPFAWLVVASVQPGAALSASVHWSFSTSNFRAVLNADTIFRPMLNSLVISGGTALVTVAVATLAAYPLSRYQSNAEVSESQAGLADVNVDVVIGTHRLLSPETTF